MIKSINNGNSNLTKYESKLILRNEKNNNSKLIKVNWSELKTGGKNVKNT
jgi:hypothetical protein